MPTVGTAPLNKHARDVLRDLANVPRVMGNASSCVRYAADVLVAKAMNTVTVNGRDRQRTVRLRGGEKITYRLNRGDIQSIRECLALGVYEIPPGIHGVGALVDLGANIGLAAIAIARTLDPSHVVCVEPSPTSAQLTERNLRQNGVATTVIEAAVGSHDGVAYFACEESSNVGRLSSSGTPVKLVSMDTVLASIPDDRRVGLMKIDIEGAEQDILQGDLSWLTRVDSILMEIHADRVDPQLCIATLREAGLELVAGPRYEVWTFARCRPGAAS